MPYYIGFFATDLNKMMKFYSIRKPVKSTYPFFGKVIGPYETEQQTDNTMTVLKRAYGYHSNPAKSEKQRRFMCADLGRLRSGKKTKTRMSERQLRDFCRKSNPMSPEKALRLTRKVIAHAKDIYQDYQSNPGQDYHDQKFIRYMKELEKYVVGSEPYIRTLAKAYENLEAARDSSHDRVR
jgi:excinuclease UvrABC nuclease subunit